MSDIKADEFEAKIERLEAIVHQLESGEVSLDDAVKLFQEGKTLSAACEGLLKSAQERIDRALDEEKPK